MPQKIPRVACLCPHCRRPVSPVVGLGGVRRLGTTPLPDTLKASTDRRTQLWAPGVEPTCQRRDLAEPRVLCRTVTPKPECGQQGPGALGPTVRHPHPLDTGHQGRGLTQVAEAAVEPRVTEAGPIEAVAPATVGTVALLVTLLAVEALGAACGMRGPLSAHLDTSPHPWRCSKGPLCPA